MENLRIVLDVTPTTVSSLPRIHWKDTTILSSNFRVHTRPHLAFPVTTRTAVGISATLARSVWIATRTSIRDSSLKNTMLRRIAWIVTTKQTGKRFRSTTTKRISNWMANTLSLDAVNAITKKMIKVLGFRSLWDFLPNAIPVTRMNTPVSLR